MSMFENKTKPELEAGNYIAYTDEPNTVVSGSGGGGGAVFLEADEGGPDTPLTPKFSFNDVKNALEAGQAVFIKTVASEGMQTNMNYMLVYSLAMDETPDDEAYTVVASEGAGVFLFEATDPNATMTDASS